MLKSNKLLLALLLPVFVLAFSFVAYALDESDFIIIDGDHYTPEEWAARQAQSQTMEQQNVNAEQLQEGPIWFNPAILEGEKAFRYEEGTIPTGPSINSSAAMDNLKVNLFEMFFNDGAWPPTGGTVVNNNVNGKFWQLNNGASTPTHEGPYGSNIPYDTPAPSDEWIITDPITITSTYHTLTFAWMTGYVWMVSPNPNGDMWVKISTDNGATWTNLWREEDHGTFPGYIGDFTEYIVTNIDLSAYDGQTVKIGFNYVALDADGFYLDWISVNDGAAPVGRCCYGTPASPSCVDDTQANCQALADFISWDGGLDCTTPCPVAGGNDDCTGADVVGPTFPATITGTTIGSTIDCPGVLDWQAVWYTFNNPFACANITIDWCGTSPDLVTVGVVLYDECPVDCGGYILHSSTTWDACPTDGNPTSEWWNMPAGDYWYPAFTGPGTYGGAPQDFQITFNVEECPDAPANDLCANAEPFASNPASVTGTTLGATPDCPGLLDWNAVWYSFEVPTSGYDYGADVVLDFCGTSPVLVTLGVVIFPDCSCGTYILHNSTVWDSCDGNPRSEYKGLTPGVYYFPAFTGPGTYGGQQQDFVLNFVMTPAPPPQPGDNCFDPVKITINGSGDLPYTDANYTCGRGDSESSTCLSLYDGGEDLFYEVEVGAAMTLKFTMDPQGTSYSGMALGTSCPPAGTTYSNCLAEAHGSSSLPKGFMIELTPGTYYLMIDTWPAPDCIPALTLVIEEFIPTPGDNCSDPLKVNLPSDAPYLDNNYTCGRGDNYDVTCLSYYDGGEDIHYEINVDVAGYYEFIHDPLGTTWTGMGLGAACPPPGTTYSQCIAEATDYSSNPHGFVVFLTPGTYYLMIDTWPSPDCIPEFDLYINYLLPPTLTYDQTTIEFCNVVTDDIGCTTLTLGNAGDIDLNFTAAVGFGLPASKEIDGANIIATPTEVSPGTTADIVFTVSNASSDAEWIDSVAIFFPAGVFVNSATDLNSLSSTRYLDWDGTTGDNVEVSWGNWNGGYGNLYSTEVGETTVNISFDAGLTLPIILDYHISGDDYGSTPHDIWGSIALTEAGWCTVNPIDGVIAGGDTQVLDVCFNATGMPEGTYFATINIAHDGGLSPIVIPVTLTVGPDHVPAAVLAIDRSGSMALQDAFGDSRFDRAKNMAHIDADVLITGGYQVSVVTFNTTGGIAVVQDFTTDLQLVNDAIDAIGDPRHDTPLAAAMCQSHCTLYSLGCGVDALYTYTDGEENESLNYDMCYICDACYRYHDSGWNYDCNPASPGSCTDWQLCLADVFAANGMNVVNYFGSPINPFGKDAMVPEDIYFLKYTADASDGEFNYFADAQYICGDANSDSNVNVSDAVFIINYVFVAGDAPQPLESANVNCDQSVNVSDAVYLINFVFVGGPAPCGCE